MFDVHQANAKVEAVMSAGDSLDAGMASLIDFCAEHEQWRGWGALRKLDFSADQKRLHRWLKRLLTKEPPPKAIKAYWFGLFNPVVGGKTTCGLYVAGAKHFDANDESFEWACDPAYFPDGRYAESQVLDEIYRTVCKAKGSVSSYGEYVLRLGFVGLVAKALATTIEATTWLGTTRSRVIAVGFDSGDGVLVGSVTKDGWKKPTTSFN